MNADSCNTSTNCRSVFVPRSANSNTAYNFLPFAHIDNVDSHCFNGGFEIGYEYQGSFDSPSLARGLFGSHNLLFQGSQVADRDTRALIADNFGLSPLFTGLLNINPHIKRQNLHFQSFFGFDNWVSGLFGQVNGTFSHENRSLVEKCSTLDTQSTSTTQFPIGYMSAFQDLATNHIHTALSGDFWFGDMQTTWRFGRFKFCDQIENGVAGVDIILGYDFLRCAPYHFGLYGLYVAPTGNRAGVTNVFSPVVGNGHHHEVGGGLTAHLEFWNNDNGHSMAFYLDGQVTTLLRSNQIRSFDFTGKGCLSRYMLLKDLVTPSVIAADGFDFNDILINGINFATRNVSSKVAVRGDASLRFIFHSSDWDIGLGYNIYGQSSENLCLFSEISCDDSIGISGRHFGFKGCTGTTCYSYITTATTSVFKATNGTTTSANLLNATASSATATSCGNVDNPVTERSDNGTAAGTVCIDWKNQLTGNGQPANAITSGTLLSTLVVANTSQPSVEVTVDALNLSSGSAPRQLTHKGFVTLNYTWSGCNWKPYLATGIEVEGGSRTTDLKLWGAWIKTGISF